VITYNIEMMQEFAQSNGGMCLSDIYINSKIKLTWKCGQGHIFERSFSNMQRNSRCPSCKKIHEGNTLDSMKKLALLRGGKCLSGEYLGFNIKLKWKCEKGHIWQTSPSQVKNGYWCPKCGIERRSFDIEKMRELASKKGGKCLSSDYINNKSVLKWQCNQGHIWETSAGIIMAGHWCPDCANIKKKHPIKIYIDYAKSKGGVCLTPQISDDSTKLRFRCALDHEWETTGHIIHKGNWCPICGQLGEHFTLSQMKKIAKKRNGKCLSEFTEINMKTVLEWECEFNHRWEASVRAIVIGWWCLECRKNLSLDEMLILDTIEDMRVIAHMHGGECLSSEYINRSTKLRWRCSHGHEWLATPSGIINSKTWCPICSNQIKSIKDMQQLAAQKGGKCLSTIYFGSEKKLKWQCSKGHIWKASPTQIRHGCWCLRCRKYQFTTTFLEEMRRIATQKGGKCLSLSYVDSQTKLKWQCNQGHIWETTSNVIKQGKWCPKCANLKKSKTIEEMQQLAVKKKGKCLSSKYLGVFVKLKWECDKGHIWNATPAHIVQGSWCRICANKKNSLSLELMQSFAEKRGGKCLSTNYVNVQLKLKWQCAQGHIWDSPFKSFTKGSWCPECYPRKKKTLKDAKSLAKKKNGFCLSSNYENSKANLKWKCEEGHIWVASYNNIKRGSWCPQCNPQRKKNLKDAQLLAQKKNGVCLSTQYEKCNATMQWKCEKGHIWSTSYSQIQKGRWCPECNSPKKITLEDAQFLARRKNGVCLSTKYENNKTIMQWKCEKGHIWDTSYSSIKRGSWCPKCGRLKNRN